MSKRPRTLGRRAGVLALPVVLALAGLARAQSDGPDPGYLPRPSPLPTGYAAETAFHRSLVALPDGDLRLRFWDVILAAETLPISIGRVYRSGRIQTGIFGPGWSSNLDVRLMLEGDFRIQEEDGRIRRYRQAPQGRFEPIAGSFVGHFLTRDPNGTYTRRWNDGTTERFDQQGRLVGRTNAGDAIHFFYADARATSPNRIEDGNGRWLELSYREGRLVEVADPLGRLTKYAYQDGRLARVTDPAGRVTDYATDKGRLAKLTLPRGMEMAFRYSPDGSLAEASGPGRMRTRYRWKYIDGAPGAELVYSYANGSWERIQITPGHYDAEELGLRAEPDLDWHKKIGLKLKRIDASGAETTTLVTDSRIIAHQKGTPYSAVIAPDIKPLEPPAGGYAPPAGEWRSRIAPLAMPPGTENTRHDAAGRPVAFDLGDGDTETWTWDAADRVVAWTDATGKTTTYAYDAHNHLTEISENGTVRGFFRYDSDDRISGFTHSSGTSLSLVYDAAGNMTRMTDGAGDSVRMTYDRANRISVVEEGAGLRTRYAYDGNGRLSRVTHPNGRSRAYTYDDAGRLGTETDETGLTTTYTYDEKGRVVGTRSSDGRRVEVEYLDTGRRITTETAAQGTWIEEYDPAGMMTKLVLPGNRVLTYTYDAEQRVTLIEDSARGRSEYTYDSAGRLVRAVDPVQGARTYRFDARGRLSAWEEGMSKATVAYGADGTRTVSITVGTRTSELVYDAEERLVRETDPDGRMTLHAYDARGSITKTESPAGTLTFQYDAEGRVVRVDHELDGRKTTKEYAYDAAGRLTLETFEDGTSERMTYDRRGNLKTATDRLGNTTTYQYDGEGRLHLTKSPYGTVRYGYDALGRVIWTDDPVGGKTRYEYGVEEGDVTVVDPSGARTRRRIDLRTGHVDVTDALGGRTEYRYDAFGRPKTFVDANGNATSLAYDADDNLIERTEASGRKTTFRYDAFGRRTGAVLPGGTTVKWTFDAEGRTTRVEAGPDHAWRYRYEPGGRSLAVEGPAGRAIYRYDALDRMIEYADPHGKRVRFSFDAPGRVEKVTTPEGEEIRYGYDKRGLLGSIETAKGTTRYGYDQTGRLVRVDRPNGMITEYAYAAGHRVASIDVRDAEGAVLFEERYTYDARGNVTGVAGTNGTHRYAYDALSRLVEAVQEGGKTERFAYDRAGNLIRTDRVDAWTYDRDQRLVRWGGTGLAYDERGKLTAVGNERKFRWSPRGLLVEVSSVDGGNALYAYDAEERRIARTAGGETTRYVYAGRRLLGEYDAAGKAKALYVPGTSEDAWASVRIDGKEYTPIRSRMGSLLALVDESGKVVQRFKYDAYGRTVEKKGTLPVDANYAGGPVDSLTGLVFLGTRYYDPQLKRFISSDPVGPDSDGNRYTYALGNPLRYRDAQGTSGTPPSSSPRNIFPNAKAPPTPEMVRRAILGQLHADAADPSNPVRQSVARTHLRDMRRYGVDVKVYGVGGKHVAWNEPANPKDVHFSEPKFRKYPKESRAIARRAATGIVGHETTHAADNFRARRMGIDPYDLRMKMTKETRAYTRQWMYEGNRMAGAKTDLVGVVQHINKSHGFVQGGTPRLVNPERVYSVMDMHTPASYDRAKLRTEVEAAVKKGNRMALADAKVVSEINSRVRQPGPIRRAHTQTRAASNAKKVADAFHPPSRGPQPVASPHTPPAPVRAPTKAPKLPSRIPRLGAGMALLTSGYIVYNDGSAWDVAANLGYSALYVVPVLGQVLMVKDAVDLAITVGSAAGTLGAEGYLAARKEYKDFFDRLDEIADLIGGEDDEEKRKRRKEVEEELYPSAGDGGFAGGGGSGGRPGGFPGGHRPPAIESMASGNPPALPSSSPSRDSVRNPSAEPDSNLNTNPDPARNPDPNPNPNSNGEANRRIPTNTAPTFQPTGSPVSPERRGRPRQMGLSLAEMYGGRPREYDRNPRSRRRSSDSGSAGTSDENRPKIHGGFIGKLKEVEGTMSGEEEGGTGSAEEGRDPEDLDNLTGLETEDPTTDEVVSEDPSSEPDPPDAEEPPATNLPDDGLPLDVVPDPEPPLPPEDEPSTTETDTTNETNPPATEETPRPSLPKPESWDNDGTFEPPPEPEPRPSESKGFLEALAGLWKTSIRKLAELFDDR